MGNLRIFFLILCGLAVLSTRPAVHVGQASEIVQEGKKEQPAISGEGEEDHEANRKILVELFLARERKNDVDKIKQELEALSITRIRPQFFRLGNPPQNIAIGKNIPALVARVAMQLAITYNGGIKYLLPEYRYFPDHIVIGSSAFDEASQIPVTPEDVEKLLNPNLSTDEFHALYRHLTGEDVRLPTYTD